MNWTKIIHSKYNCMQFCPIPLCVKEFKNSNSGNLSNMHRNLISSKLYQGPTECKVSFISADQFLRYSIHKILETNRHFLKMVKSCSGYIKTCKSIESRMQKIFESPILCSYVYRRKLKRKKKIHVIRHKDDGLILLLLFYSFFQKEF